MAPGNLTPDRLESNLLVPDSATMMDTLIAEAIELKEYRPEILDRICADQDALAKRKKEQREADRRFYESQTPNLTGLSVVEQSVEVEALGDGRPRMDPELVLVLLVVRGYVGSVCTRKAVDWIRDSLALYKHLSDRGWTMPGVSTMVENLNAVSVDTRELIHRAQLAFILDEGLDDFKTMIGDSTSVKANSDWPTDAGMILKFLERAFHVSQRLDRFGLTNVSPWYVPTWLKIMRKCHFTINCCSGKRRAERKRKAGYRRLQEKAHKTADYLQQELSLQRQAIDLEKYAPSVRENIIEVFELMEQDLADARTVMAYAEERIEHGVVRPSKEKILSISDRDAAYIKKGTRPAVIGYKPQLARSGNGFATALIVPEGNAADSTQLWPLTQAHIHNTGVVPELVSVDDGYASATDRDEVLKAKVAAVSISGSKGKRMTDEMLWESPLYEDARRNRSAVESIIFVLKYVFEFGRLRRRGVDAARAEELEKIIAYNFMRIADLRMKKRRQEDERKAA